MIDCFFFDFAAESFSEAELVWHAAVNLGWKWRGEHCPPQINDFRHGSIADIRFVYSFDCIKKEFHLLENGSIERCVSRKFLLECLKLNCLLLMEGRVMVYADGNILLHDVGMISEYEFQQITNAKKFLSTLKDKEPRTK